MEDTVPYKIVTLAASFNGMNTSTNTTTVMPTEEEPMDPRVAEVKVIIQGIIVPTICLIGMVLNMINFVVLRDKRLKESCYTYLVGLAVADFLSLLMFGVNGIGRGHYAGQYNWRMFETFVYFPVCLIATAASVFLIVMVTAERFVFLYWPIPSRMWCTRSVARKLVAFAWILSLVLNAPRFFVFNVNDEGELESTDFGQSDFYQILTWILFFLIAVGCGVILIVFNALLIKGIHNANEKRRSLKTNNASNNEKRDEVRLTRTLISVIFLYLIGEIPSSIFSRVVFGAILGEDNQHHMKSLWYEICVSIATIFVVCQHSLNFVFYCIFNKRFYKVFQTKLLFCKKQCKEPLNSELATVVDMSNEQSQEKDNGHKKSLDMNGATERKQYQQIHDLDTAEEKESHQNGHILESAESDKTPDNIPGNAIDTCNGETRKLMSSFNEEETLVE